jgi:tetratricopeptide (TPR) repeat protein
MSHLDERTLGLHAINPALIRPAAAAHLAACDECRLAAEALREFEDALREPESWPAAVDPELRAFAVRSEREDAAALALLEEFREPAAAARFVWADIANRTEYQTGGVARLLCKWANGMCSRNPLYALKLAEAATAIAHGLLDADYPRDTIHELRGQAMKEQANALFFLGRFSDAMRALERAEVEYRKLPYETTGLIAVTYIRGLIHYEQEKYDDAERAAHAAAEAALQSGDTERYMSARHLLGYVLFDRHQYTAAAENFEAILRYGHARRDAVWIAHESLAVGLCYLELRRLSEARRSLHEALRIYSDLGFGPEVTRVNWAIARLIFAEGTHASEAIYQLRRCIKELTEQQIATDAALVAIDLAEILNVTGRVREIPKVLTNVVQTFMDAGKFTGALTALAFLKAAALDGTITPALATYVRRFVRHADRQPELAFEPPPSPVV